MKIWKKFFEFMGYFLFLFAIGGFVIVVSLFGLWGRPIGELTVFEGFVILIGSLIVGVMIIVGIAIIFGIIGLFFAGKVTKDVQQGKGGVFFTKGPYDDFEDE